MTHKRQWIGFGLALAAALLLVTFTPWRDDDTGSGQPGGIGAAGKTAREQRFKTASVRRDVEATARLCTLESAREFHKLGNSGVGHEEIQRMLQMHPHMEYVRITRKDGSRAVAGEIPSGIERRIGRELEQAERAAGHGSRYESDPVLHGGHRYMVLAVPAKAGTRVAGVVRQDIVDEVERHQKRNLRLVPFPAEGRYRTESALPNTTKDITVKNGDENGQASHYHIDEVVVRFRTPPTDGQINAIMRQINGKTVRKLGYTHVFTSATMDAEKMMRYFTKEWNPVYVEPHYLYLTNGELSDSDGNSAKPIVPNDLLYAQYQWNLPQIETEKGWNLSKGSQEVAIAVLDTGVQSDHPDLVGKLAQGLNIVDKKQAPDDDVGHGTHVAGIIAASVNNGEGVAGISWYNKIMPVKVLDSSGAGTTYSVAEGLIWATDNGAKVINMSLGNYASAQFLHDAIRYAYDRDVVLIAASGNDDTDRPGYPAAYPEVVAVAATDANSKKAAFSNYGDYIDVAAPGDTIPSTYPGNQYAALSGTSMASPHVTALAALIRSINPSLTNVEVMKLLTTTATDLGDKGKDNYYGYGQIDVVRALEAAEQSASSLVGVTQRMERRIASLKARYGFTAEEK
ncbi:serine protease [Paenibacillus darwinianus]|uniref:Serine protease n=1 Tax=Paenibacillus darwinianus TaxID=1380763 RepID=A0A9W5S3U3_9BACL|nr:S8 family peptidase [Paenibacillus darwinianus]EXX91875.1 serine protease [Paenibacillus darwinianus]EXX92350.1 serine protease [Paenibacillus darwinianus]EXX92718.1 serine protease [Paenibacillus darwinianus]